MTRWSDRAGAIILLLFCCSPAHAQDIYDEPRSRIYARHLFDEGRYHTSATEYGRLVLMTPDDSMKVMFLRAHRLDPNPVKDITLVSYTLPTVAPYSSKVSEEYARFLMTANAFPAVQHVLASGALDSGRFFKYSFQSNLLQKDWEAARSYFIKKQNVLSEAEDPGYSMLLARAGQLPVRSPALAATLSAIIPGAGKVYAGEWKDGLVALLFTGFTAYEAVSGFRIAGRRSVLGWIYGGLAFGFYSGTVYGSYKSAHHFNVRHEDLLIKDARDLIFSTY